MIPSVSHPWSPWRPLAAIGWLVFAGLFVGFVMLVSAYDDRVDHQRAVCAIRWGTAKTPADSVRVAGDCGIPRRVQRPERS